MDIDRHVIGCHLTQETRAQNPLDDVVGNICQAIYDGLEETETVNCLAAGCDAAATAAFGRAVADIARDCHVIAHTMPFNSRNEGSNVP